jgi:glycosyltransferase involved in cell wall biosynthesis
MNIKYILSHPIHYQVALIKFLTKKGLKIKVLFRSDMHTKKFYDPGFNKKIKIATNVLKGYKYEYLEYIGPNKVGSIYPLTTEFIIKIFDHKTDIIWIHGIKNWYNLCLILLAKFFKKKVFVRDEVFHKSKKRDFINKILNYIFYLIIDNFIDIYLAIGSENKKYYIDNNINKNKIVTVPYVVNNNFFYKKKKITKNKSTTFLFVAKLIKKKGPDLFLEALKLLKKNLGYELKARFLLVGDGYMKKKLERFAINNKLNNVKFISFKNQKKLAKIYQSSDVFIMPSRIEPWGLTVNEAMAGGNAIISSDIVGSSFDLVKNGINGLIFKNNSVEDLAKKILQISKNKKQLKIFKSNSLKIISKWDFERCYLGLKKSIKFIKIYNN